MFQGFIPASWHEEEISEVFQNFTLYGDMGWESGKIVLRIVLYFLFDQFVYKAIDPQQDRQGHTGKQRSHKHREKVFSQYGKDQSG